MDVQNSSNLIVLTARNLNRTLLTGTGLTGVEGLVYKRCRSEGFSLTFMGETASEHSTDPRRSLIMWFIRGSFQLLTSA